WRKPGPLSVAIRYGVVQAALKNNYQGCRFMLQPVIMAGGSGSRLWPLSRQLNPKQFLKLTDKKLSMLQATVARLEGISDAAPLVICNEEHRFLVAEQLRQQGKGGNSIILEPVGRNTAPAIALAALHLAARNPDALMLVLP